MSSDSEKQHEEEVAKELQAMREDDLIQFIRETVEQLNRLGDRLETYAQKTTKEDS